MCVPQALRFRTFREKLVPLANEDFPRRNEAFKEFTLTELDAWMMTYYRAEKVHYYCLSHSMCGAW